MDFGYCPRQVFKCVPKLTSFCYRLLLTSFSLTLSEIYMDIRG